VLRARISRLSVSAAKGAIPAGTDAPPAEVFGVIETALRAHFAKEIPA
jgi:hypothetical protein